MKMTGVDCQLVCINDVFKIFAKSHFSRTRSLRRRKIFVYSFGLRKEVGKLMLDDKYDNWAVWLSLHEFCKAMVCWILSLHYL